jgi:phage tail protein X
MIGSGIVVIPTAGVELFAQALVGKYVNPEGVTQGIVYTSLGERWDTIAYKMYGDATLVRLLILNNPGIAAIDYVPQGSQIFVPLFTPLSDTSTTTPWG